jgi:hypothetical protein
MCIVIIRCTDNFYHPIHSHIIQHFVLLWVIFDALRISDFEASSVKLIDKRELEIILMKAAVT